MLFSVPYGHSDLHFEIAWGADVAETCLPDAPPPELRLPALNFRNSVRALVIFTDATRHAPNRWFAERILPTLPFPKEQIHFLCAVGMHRPSTYAEKVALLGEDIVNQYQILDHDPNTAITVGQIDGIPVQVNRLLVEQGTYVIAFGVVEPHQYAGYSGGMKTAVIGCGGVQTIEQTHGAAMLDREGVRLGVIENNPFQNFVRRAGAAIGSELIVNAVMPTPDRITHAAAGGIEVHDQLVAAARQLYETPVPNAPYDVVIAGVTPPKDANLYQASRAATYIALSGSPVLRRGGVIILPARLPEGAGQGAGERNFFQVLQQFGEHPDDLIHYLRERGCQAGQQRAYMIAQMLQTYHCIIVGAEEPRLLHKTGLRSSPTIEAALAQAAELLGIPQPRTLVVPDALRTLPRPA